MKLYAESRRYRARQLAGDIAVLLWIALWVRIGIFINELVNRLSGPGRTVESAGGSFASSVERFGEDVAGVPVVGDALTGPFEAIAEAGRTLQQAGQAQQDVVHTLAVWLGILLAVIPIGYVLLKYVPERIRWVREASAADRLRIDASDLKVFAIRALANQPLYELRRAASDPADAFNAGEYEALAELELGRLGLKIQRD